MPGYTLQFRLIIVLSLVFLLLVLTENSLGKTSTQGLTAAEILEAELQLYDVGYWTGPIDGSLDSDSRQALIAFQKIEGRRPTGKLTSDWRKREYRLSLSKSHNLIPPKKAQVV